MCGRYDLSQNPAAIRARFAVPEVPDFAANADVRPTQRAPIVRFDASGARRCELARWGLVPSWAKDAKIGSRLINARSETADRLPSFRAAFARRRCLVPVNAFYEWSGPAGQRSKWRLEVPEHPWVALAGLWESWHDPGVADAPALHTYTILTCAASAAVAPLHDRMPVILPSAREAAWLDPQSDPRDLLVPWAGALRIVAA